MSETLCQAQGHAWPFAPLRQAAYRVILADPPWAFRTYNDVDRRKTPEAHYRTMGLAAIAALPVAALAHPEGAALALWTTGPMLAHALDIARARWGFDYKTGGAWAKRSRGGGGWAFGTGYIFRNAAEFFLLLARGNPRKRLGRAARSQRNLIEAPAREHSRKPDDLHGVLEALYPGPYCELFARERRAGWDAWGNEVGKFDRLHPEPRGLKRESTDPR